MGVVAAQKQVHIVALRKESVDRNAIAIFFSAQRGKSLSARRAWIEIQFAHNTHGLILSLSARRAWIEISNNSKIDGFCKSRSPQGERG